MEYKIKVKVSEKDYKKFNYDTYFHKPATIVLLILVILILAHLSLISFISFRRTERISEFFPAITLIFLYIFVFFIHWPRRLSKLYKSDRALQEEQELTLTESGITEVSARGSFSYTCEDFKKVFFGKSVISVYVAINKALLIPRHCFSSKEEEAQIESFIKEHYAKAKK